MTSGPAATWLSGATQFFRRLAPCWTLVVSAGQLACDMPPAEVADHSNDALWIAATSVDFNNSSSILVTPIARRDSDGWSVPWPDATSATPLNIAIDSTGSVDPVAVMAALPLDMNNPQFPGIAAPHRWLHYGRFRVNAPNRSLEPIPLRVTGLAPFGVFCNMLWKLRTRAAGAGGQPTTVTARFRHGVTVSRRPDEVLRASDLPRLNEIAARLGYERYTNRQTDDTHYRDFSWLGLFRFGTTVLGVLEDKGSERSSYDLVELDGENSRIIASFHRGDC